MLIDKVHILVQAGNGGNGCESLFRRTDKKVVPNGGDGGKGASIIFRVDDNAPPLAHLRYKRHIVAENGGHGGSNNKRGKAAEDLIVLVRRGTRLYDRKRNLLIRELKDPGDEVIVAEGGHGGFGNSGGRKTTLGDKGQIFDLEITFRLTADIFLMGLPNSGRSTLLNGLTRAQVKMESYPFTTSSPELGVYKWSDYEQITICDFPSLYEGSHEGRGMGNEFLKHLEHAKFIFLVVDPFSEFAPSLKEGIKLLRNEIERFNKDYLDIPYGILVNKMDMPDAREVLKKEKLGNKIKIYPLSAKTGEGLDVFKEFLKTRIEEENAKL